MLADELQEGVAGNEAGAQGFEVRGMYLAVDEGEAFAGGLSDEGDEGGFGGVADMCEHGFSEEAVAQFNAVEATDQLVILPAFYGEGVTGFVKTDVCLLHFAGDPGAVLAFAEYFPAVSDNAFKVLVEGDAEGLFFEYLFHGSRYFECFGE